MSIAIDQQLDVIFLSYSPHCLLSFRNPLIIFALPDTYAFMLQKRRFWLVKALILGYESVDIRLQKRRFCFCAILSYFLSRCFSCLFFTLIFFLHGFFSRRFRRFRRFSFFTRIVTEFFIFIKNLRITEFFRA